MRKRPTVHERLDVIEKTVQEILKLEKGRLNSQYGSTSYKNIPGYLPSNNTVIVCALCRSSYLSGTFHNCQPSTGLNAYYSNSGGVSSNGTA